MKLAIGELIPLELQLSDGSTSQYPRALLYNAAGTLLATVDLAHVALGRYAADTQTMPSSAYVAATYLVYSDAGHTTLAAYASTADVWQLDTMPTAAAIAAAVLAATLEGTVTVGRGLRAILRQLLAKRSGYDLTTVTVRDMADTKTSHVIVQDSATAPTAWTSVTLTDLD